MIVAVYNYKGGVGKTTIVTNLGSSLANTSHRVLLVDADPQCNLSSYFLHADTTDDDEEEEILPAEGFGFIDGLADYVPPAELPSDGIHEDEYNLHSLMRPVIFGGPEEPIEKVGLRHIRENLFLLPGSPLIVEFERHFGLVEVITPQATVILGYFRYLLHSLAAANKIDVILVDFGPSSGILNRTFVMSCDYILPPSFADRLSLSSVEGLLNVVLPAWYEWYASTISSQFDRLRAPISRDLAEKCKFNPNAPRLLPIILTGFKTKALPGRKPAPGDSSMITRNYRIWSWALDAVMKKFVINAPMPQLIPFTPLVDLTVIPLLKHMAGTLEESHKNRIALVNMKMSEKKRGRKKDAAATHRDEVIRTARIRFETLSSLIINLP